MVAARTKLNKKKRRGRPSLTKATPPMGYAAAARALRVTTAHLWRVLNGERKSPSLVTRYRALVGNPKFAA